MEIDKLKWMRDFFSGECRDEVMYRLRRWHGLSLREIGQVFGVTEKAVLAHIIVHQRRDDTM